MDPVLSRLFLSLICYRNVDEGEEIVLTNKMSSLRRCLGAISPVTMLLLLGPVQPMNGKRQVIRQSQ
jgi:hypothetical protein